MDRKRVESALNVVLGIVIVVFGGIALKSYYENNFQPKTFKQPEFHAPPLYKVEAKVPDGTDPDARPEADSPHAAFDPWLADHFTAPIDLQGEPPQDWTEIEANLSPESCGTCHPQQLSDWQTSWHHLGMGPGMMGQLVDANDGMVKACQRCHAPNAEQYPRLKGSEAGAAYQENPEFDADLRVQGLTCAGCHVREWTRYGPESDAHPVGSETAPELGEGETADSEWADPNEGIPHGGFVAKAAYKEAVFCERCHDFREGEGKVLNEKKLQETYQEWRRTEAAAEGKTCQTCHMPDGAHTFKGIHDKEFVQTGFEATAELKRLGDKPLEPLEAELTITNVGVAHRMPSYTTPRIVLIIEQLDEGEAVIEGTKQAFFVGRETTLSLSREVYDTRILPGESRTLMYSAERAEAATGLSARVEVWPDEQYRKNYENWLSTNMYGDEGSAILEEAHEAATNSRYIAWERSVDLASQSE